MSSYTEKHIKAVKLIANKAGALVYLHNNSYRYYRNINKGFIIISATLSYIFGASGITTLVVTDNKIFMYVVQGLMFFVGLIITIYGAFKIDDKAERQKWSCDQNTELYLMVKQELSKPELERTRAEKFIHKCLKHEFRISNDSPHVPKTIIKRYYRTYADLAIPYEILFQTENLLSLDVSDKKTWSDEETRDDVYDYENAEALEEIRIDIPPLTPKELPTPRDSNVFNKLRNTLFIPRVIDQPIIDTEQHLKPRVRHSIIDRMAELEEFCNREVSFDIKQILEKHQKPANNNRKRSRREHTLTSIEQYEIEKFHTGSEAPR